MKRMKWIGGMELAKTAHYALVQQHIRYGLFVWRRTLTNFLLHNLKDMKENNLKKHLWNWLVDRSVYSIKEFFDILSNKL